MRRERQSSENVYSEVLAQGRVARPMELVKVQLTCSLVTGGTARPITKATTTDSSLRLTRELAPPRVRISGCSAKFVGQRKKTRVYMHINERMV